jgi:hypothetical protein
MTELAYAIWLEAAWRTAPGVCVTRRVFLGMLEREQAELAAWCAAEDEHWDAVARSYGTPEQQRARQREEDDRALGEMIDADPLLRHQRPREDWG